MKKTVLVILALAGALLGAQPATLTPAQTLERRGLGDLDFSPDGARLVFTVTEPVKGAARQRNIWMLDVASGATRQLTFSTKSDSSPRWAPDGRSIAFLSENPSWSFRSRITRRIGERFSPHASTRCRSIG